MSFHPSPEPVEKNEGRASGVPAGPTTSAGPTLLPSVFSHDDFPETFEGLDGTKLHELFFSLAGGTMDETAEGGNLREVEASKVGQESQPPQQFNPLFVVIEDPVTGEHHHPYIHYVFSDDGDADLMTNALLHNLSPQAEREESETGNKTTTNQLESSQPNEDRVLIIDLDESGRNVTSAQSLSSNWQITDTQISVAPTFNNGSAPEEAGLMLRISGVEGRPMKNKITPEELFNQASSRSEQNVLGTMNDLAEQFQQELDVVQRLLKIEKESIGAETSKIA